MQNPTFSAAINFQDGTVPVVGGYLVDNFEGYANRGNGFSYGWVTEVSVLDGDPTMATPIDGSLYPANAINERTGQPFDGYDPRLTGYAHFDLGTSYPAGDGNRVAWEIAAPNGWYEVTAAVGDTGGPNDSDNKLYIEGVLSSDFVPTNDYKTELVTTFVEVTDGFLTLSAQGGTFTELQYLEIEGQLVDHTPGDSNPAIDDYPIFIDPRAVAQDGNEIFEVALEPASGFAEGVDPEADLFLGVTVAPGRTGIAFESLSDGSIQLYETLTGTPVPFTANTTAGADSVTITPDSVLSEFTSYTLVVDGATDRGPIGNETAPTREFLKFSTTFVTGEERDSTNNGVAFTDTLELDGAAEGAFGFTSVELSPDGSQLYVSTITGEIKRWDIDPVSGALDANSVETFTPGGDFDLGAAGRRGIIGLTFDPLDPDTIWITDNYPIPLDGRDDSVPEFSGRISKVTLGTGGDLASSMIETYITGLPRSNGDHVTNSLEFRANPDYHPVTNPGVPEYLLYTVQGSNSAMGEADDAWGLRPERLLTAAVIEIDPTRTAPSGGFDVTTEPLPADGLNRRFADSDNDLKNGGIPIDSGPFNGNFLHFDAKGVATVRTGSDPSSTLVQSYYDPFDANAVAKVFATGPRNAYDLVWHSNGFLYVPTNGSAAGGNTPDDPSTTGVDESLTSVSLQPDYLFKMTEGGYYGHPNPLNDEYVLNGGNPTGGTDANEVPDYAVGIAPDPNYQISDTYNLGNSRSPNGAVEYTSDRLGTVFQNSLLFVEYSGGNDIRAVTFDGSGDVVDDFVLRDFSGDVIQYTDPLDVVENPATGQVYLITLKRDTGDSQVVRLDPTPPPTRIEAEDFNNLQVFTVNNNGNASGGQILQSNSTTSQASATHTFSGVSGVYSLTLGHFDENDGHASMSVLVNGVAVKAFVWDKELGSGNGNAATLTQESFSNIALNDGDVITLVGQAEGGEPLRTDYLDISYVSAPDPAEAAPVNAAPASVTTDENVAFTFSGTDLVSVADTDGDPLTTVLSVNDGVLDVTTGGGADIIGDGTDTVTLSGSIADVNAALAGLVYTPNLDFDGSDTLTVETSDGSLSDNDQVSITVTPFGNANADIAVQSLDPVFFSDRLHFSYIDEPNTQGSAFLTYKDSATVRLSSVGTEALSFIGFELTGPFELANPTVLDGLVLQPGQSVDVEVLFDRSAFTLQPNNVSSVFTGELRVNTNDLEDSQVVVDLAGNWQRIDEGSWEPNVNEIWETFGFGNFIPGLPFVDSDPSPLDNGGIYEAFNALEVLSPYWKIADGYTEGKATLIATYAGRGSAELGLHRPFAKGAEVIDLDSATNNSQRILPEIGNSFVRNGAGTVDPVFTSATFTNSAIPNNWQGDDVFGIKLENFSTDPTLNNIGNPPSGLPEGTVLGHWMRIFQAVDENGTPIDNVYLGIQDFSGSNGDYNDNLLIIEGVEPVSSAPVNTAPVSVSLAEGTSIDFIAANLISVDDPDGIDLTPTMETRLNVDQGILAISAPGAATVDGSGTDAVTISGSIAEVNTALASLSYTPNANYDGADTLTISSLDGALTGTSQVAITVTPVDGPPEVVSAVISDVTTSGAATSTLTVEFADDNAIDVSSIDVGDITVTGPGGTLTVSGVSVDVPSDGSPRIATYTIAAPGGGWDQSDNGTYSVALDAGEVLDDGGMAVPADPALASFDVTVPADRVEAEAMTVVQGFSINSSSSASGGQLLKGNGNGEQIARHVFTGADGIYDLEMFYWDENDGVASFAMKVNGFTVDSYVWDQDFGSGNVNNATRTSTITSGVTLHTGDEIDLTGFVNAGERLRIDALDFTFTGPLVPSANAPVNTAPATASLTENGSFAFTAGDAVSVADADGDPLTVMLSVSNGTLAVTTGGGAEIIGDGTANVGLSGTVAEVNAALAGLVYTPANGFTGGDTLDISTSDGVLSDDDSVAITVTAIDNAPTVVSAVIDDVTTSGAATSTLTVTYADDGAVDVSSIDVGDITVTGPGGTLTVSGVSVDVPSDGSPRIATYTIAAPGGGWDQSDNGTYSVALDAGEVLDDGGMAVPADPALASFDVTVSPPAPVRVEAEAMTVVQGFSINSLGSASGGQLLKGIGNGEQIARHVFTGADGIYDLEMFYWDENDGVASFAMKVNGFTVDSYVWDQDFGSGNVNNATRTSTITSGVTLHTGDEIDLTGFVNAGERLRIDALDFTFTGPLVPSANAPVNTAPATASLTENGSFAFTAGDAVSVADADGDPLTVMLSVSNGTLAVTTGGGAEIIGDGTANVGLSGTVAEVNAALAGLVYTPANGFTGGDTLDISTSDGVLSDDDSVAITVTAIDNAPTVVSAVIDDVTTSGAATSTLTVTYADDGAVDVSSIDVGDITVTGPGGTLTVSGVSVDVPSDGSPRIATYTIAAPGGGWDQSDNGTYSVALDAGEVLDDGGMAVPADPALASFDVTVSPPAPVRVEAEAMTVVQGFSINSLGSASGGQLLKGIGNGEQIARHVFTGADGIYDLEMFYWDENDGVASFALEVNGIVVDSYVWDQDLGSGNANNTTRTSTITSGVELHTGDEVDLTGFVDAGERLRIDALDFTFVGDIVV